jgi:hypothetical protein
MTTMAITPYDWSVVIVGRWNPAILTPSGIARRLFKLDSETPVEVSVPLDTVAPPLVKYERMTVVAGGDRLIIKPDDYDYQQLASAMELGVRAVQALPETPLAAVGINVKFSADQQLESLQVVTSKAKFDNRLSDKNFVISGRSLTRTLDWKGGRLNLTIGQEQDKPFEVQFNFELRSSDSGRHIDWLSIDVNEIEGDVKRILFECIPIEEED